MDFLPKAIEDIIINYKNQLENQENNTCNDCDNITLIYDLIECSTCNDNKCDDCHNKEPCFTQCNNCENIICDDCNYEDDFIYECSFCLNNICYECKEIETNDIIICSKCHK